MSYVAIARKWRPRTFEDIAGQTHVTRTLTNAIRLGRIHHAFLFTGARGVGKTTAARTLARCLSCEREGPRPDPCGECGNCKDILAGTCPDIIEIDGASNNSVEDVRELRESVRYMPQRCRYKVYIIDEVHMLSRGAFNALLKTLEEPPPHVVFIFATTEPQKIPETILSRVQRFDFKRIPMQVVTDTLSRICTAEGVAIPEGGLRLIARAGEGSMRDSQSLLDQVISFAGNEASTEQVAEILGLVDRKLLYEMLEGLVRGEPDRCLETIDRVYGYGYDLSEFTAEMLELLRNATLVGLSPASRRWLDLPDDEVQRMDALAQDVAPEVFVRSFEVMLDVHEQVARAPRPRLVLEMAVARLVSIRPARPLDQVVQRLGELERRLRQGGAQARPRDPRAQPREGGRRGGDGGSEDGGSSDDEPGPAASTAQASTHGGLALAAVIAPAEAPVRAPSLRALPPPLPETAPLPEAPGSAEPELRTPPAAPADASPEQRFHAFRRWLRGGGLDFDLWAEDSLLIEVATPELRVGFRSEFQVRQARRKTMHPHLVQGLRTFFPGCSSVSVELAIDGQGSLSQREADRLAYADRVKELETQLQTHPLIQQLGLLLGARVDAVVPDAPVRAEPPRGSVPPEPVEEEDP